MGVGRILHPSNRRVRLLVGLFLAGLFCVQCTQNLEAIRTKSQFVSVLDGKTISPAGPEVAARLESLARTDHVALLEYCLDHYRGRYRDFTCTFIKQEKIHGVLGKEQWVGVKFLQSPFSVAMAWTPETAPIGDRALYVEGKHDDQMLVRPSGLLAWLGTQKRKPDSPEAMQNTLRPINQFGFERGMRSLLDVYCQARRNGDLRQEFGGHAEVDGRRAVVLVRYLPPKDDYPAYKTLIYIDEEYLVPTCIEGFDWDNQDAPSSRYVYKDVKFNVSLTPDDFLPEANGMKPPK